jgi:hypothetical protein
MARLGSTRTARARQMRRVLQRWERSGLTLKAFGERERIAASRLGWWRHVFRQAELQRVSSVSMGSRVAGSRFVEVQRAAVLPCSPGVIEVVLRSGHVLRVPAGIEAGAVRVVVSALDGTC